MEVIFMKRCIINVCTIAIAAGAVFCSYGMDTRQNLNSMFGDLTISAPKKKPQKKEDHNNVITINDTGMNYDSKVSVEMAKQWAQQAHQAYDRNDYKNANELAQKAISQRTSLLAQVEGLFLLGNIRFSEKKYEDALYYFAQFIKTSPKILVSEEDKNATIVEALLKSGKSRHQLSLRATGTTQITHIADGLIYCGTAISLSNSGTISDYKDANKEYKQLLALLVEVVEPKCDVAYQNETIQHAFMISQVLSTLPIKKEAIETIRMSLGNFCARKALGHFDDAEYSCEQEDMPACVKHAFLSTEAVIVAHQCFKQLAQESKDATFQKAASKRQKEMVEELKGVLTYLNRLTLDEDDNETIETYIKIEKMINNELQTFLTVREKK